MSRDIDPYPYDDDNDDAPTVVVPPHHASTLPAFTRTPPPPPTSTQRLPVFLPNPAREYVPLPTPVPPAPASQPRMPFPSRPPSLATPGTPIHIERAPTKERGPGALWLVLILIALCAAIASLGALTLREATSSPPKATINGR